MRRLLLIIAFFLLMPVLPVRAATWTCTCPGAGAAAGTFCTESSLVCNAYCDQVFEALVTGASPTKPEIPCDVPPTTPSTGGAVTTSPGRTVNLVNPLNATSIPELVGNIIRAAVGVVGAIALLIFVYGGFLMLTSQGEAAKIQAGKDAMKWTAVGLAVVFSSYALVSFVLSALTK